MVLSELTGTIEHHVTIRAAVVVHLEMAIEVRLGEEIRLGPASSADIVLGRVGDVLLLRMCGPEVALAPCAVLCRVFAPKVLEERFPGFKVPTTKPAFGHRGRVPVVDSNQMAEGMERGSELFVAERDILRDVSVRGGFNRRVGLRLDGQCYPRSRLDLLNFSTSTPYVVRSTDADTRTW